MIVFEKPPPGEWSCRHTCPSHVAHSTQIVVFMWLGLMHVPLWLDIVLVATNGWTAAEQAEAVEYARRTEEFRDLIETLNRFSPYQSYTTTEDLCRQALRC